MRYCQWIYATLMSAIIFPSAVLAESNWSWKLAPYVLAPSIDGTS
ncbi:MAG: hypothetical protein ACU0BK_12860 [Shimia sp.]